MANPIIEGENEQVTIYSKDGSVKTAQSGRREDETQSELANMLNEGWSTTPFNQASTDEGKAVGQALHNFMPESVLEEFANQWAESGDRELAIGATRNTKAWKDEYGYLMRDDGTLVMSELSAASTIATYKQTLAEVGIADFTDFEDDFKTMVGGHETGDPVSAEEFQHRINVVYSGVKEQIPEVERLFREQHNLPIDGSTIFAALINPKIQDKVLAGDIATIQLQAEASSRGFTTTFANFQQLKNMGLTQQQAKGIYETAGDLIEQAGTLGRTLDIETIEQAGVGSLSASQQLQKISSEIESQSGVTLGAAKKDDKVTGLIA